MSPFKSSIAIALSSIICQQSQAQEATNSEIEQITVTAQKRSQRIIDVPVSIAAVTAEALEKSGIQQLSELGDYVPNVNITSAGSLDSAVQIRGVGSHSRNIGFDTRVGVYVDGIYMGQSPAINQDLIDLERVEILRGPQGALFGKNTVAGAINLISKKPSDELETEVSIQIGNYNAQQLTAKSNIPLTEKAFLNLSASKIDRDGYINNTLTGDKLEDRNSQSYRAQLKVDVTDKLEILATADTQSVKQNPIVSEGLTDPLGLFLVKSKANYHVSNDLNPSDNRDTWGAALHIDYTLDNDSIIRSISSYRDTQSDFGFDIDYSALDIATADYQDDYEQTTQEFQLVSPDNGHFNYLLGLYYYKQTSNTQRNAIVGSDLANYLTSILGPLPPFFIPSDQLINNGELKTESYAIFGNFNYDITERLHLGIGLRYSEETKDVDWNLDGNTSGLFAIGTGQIIDSRTDYDFSPSISLNYDFSKDLVGYARYAEGYKSGGYNLDYVTQTDLAYGVEFDKETVVSYEFGLKGMLWNGDLQFSFAAFDTNYDDYQVNQFIDLGDGFTSISTRNAAEVSTKGAELELTAHTTDSLSISASIGVLDGKFDSFSGGGVAGSDASGKTIPGAADFQGALSLDYYDTLTDTINYTVHIGYTYTGGSYTTVDNVRNATTLADNQTIDWGYLPSKSIMDIRVAILDQDDVWSLAFWSRNAFDESYLASSSRDFLGTLTNRPGTPRMYGVEAKYRF